jgi:hypothetical protein
MGASERPPGEAARLLGLLPPTSEVAEDAPELVETAALTAGLLALFAGLEPRPNKDPTTRRGRPPSPEKVARVKAMASRPPSEIAGIVGLAESTVRRILEGGK